MPAFKCQVTFTYTTEITLDGTSADEVKQRIETATNDQVAHFHGHSFVHASDGVITANNITEVVN